LAAVARRIRRCSSIVRVVGLRLAIADRRVEVGEEVNRQCAMRPQRRRALRGVKASARSVDFHYPLGCEAAAIAPGR
jgi:hypothetical protein